MSFVIYARDKAGALEVRKTNRDAHLAYVEATGVVSIAGPLLDGDGQMAGSLLVLEVEDLAAAEAWAAEDPYAKAGLFAQVDIRGFKRVR
ncbi:MAG: YciI family protein [Pseudomonadota bacterium]